MMKKDTLRERKKGVWLVRSLKDLDSIEGRSSCTSRDRVCVISRSVVCISSFECASLKPYYLPWGGPGTSSAATGAAFRFDLFCSGLRAITLWDCQPRSVNGLETQSLFAIVTDPKLLVITRETRMSRAWKRRGVCVGVREAPRFRPQTIPLAAKPN